MAHNNNTSAGVGHSFELMTNTSGDIMDVVLGQRKDGKLNVRHYVRL